MITFQVSGTPIPKQSFRYAKAGSYQPQQLKDWQARIAWIAHQAMIIPTMTGDVKVEIIFVLPDRRKRDIDNLSKAVLDAIKGVVIQDDDQVTNLVLWKYVDKSNPGITVTITQLTGGA